MNSLIDPPISNAFPCNNALKAAERCQDAWVVIVPLLGTGIPEIAPHNRMYVLTALLRVLCEWRMLRLVSRPASAATTRPGSILQWAIPHFIVECGIRMIVMDIISKYDMTLVMSGIEWAHELLAEELAAVSGTICPHASCGALESYINDAFTINWGSGRVDILPKSAFHTLIDTSHDSGGSLTSLVELRLVDKGFLDMMERTSMVLAAIAVMRWAVRHTVPTTTSESPEGEQQHAALLLWFRKRASQQHSEPVRTGMRERLIATELSPLHSGTEEPASKVAAQTDPTHAQSIIDKFSRPFHEFIGDDHRCNWPAASDCVLLGLFDYYMCQLFAIEWHKHYSCDDRNPLFASRRLKSYADDRMKSPPPIIMRLDGASYVLVRGTQVGTIERCTRHPTFARALVGWIDIVLVERGGKLTLGKNVSQFLYGIVNHHHSHAATTSMDVRLIDIL